MNKYEAAEILHEPVGNEREGMQCVLDDGIDIWFRFRF